ncbi:hypothetical protein QNI19_24795 [Cytophagaceae bacterium DM2B3-1]|uniref:Uncharacterized protein n=1 Tax=Xanthocytophaga flava TaxID=3048013 RepID=A0ABT7CU68_9BACT|nr:hypothetical protein [Xanthocytophaga flavus]MDJ1466840.1 hypothetical protein [Xanthocytophaga flavus]MDJ1496179.1 hypothetical protein [Xanthocytophaga flavus]
MDFNEMKTIWNLQNNQPLYTIDEQALHERIQQKKQQAFHITQISELLLIIVNLGCGCFIASINKSSISLYLLAAWMLVSGLYILISRIRRIHGNKRFDRSIQGDMEHALSVATYQVHISLLGRWNIVPIGILVLFSLFENGKPIWIAVVLFIFLALVHYTTGWEHNLYKTRKRELETLQNQLKTNTPSDIQTH